MFSITIPEFSNPLAATWWALLNGGWVFIAIAVLYGIWWLYLDYIQGRFIMNTKYILLSIDVPKENEQTPKAVEHLFGHFHGIHKTPSWLEKYRDGYVQPTISLQAGRERHADFRVDLGLVDAGNSVLNRILNGGHVNFGGG